MSHLNKDEHDDISAGSHRISSPLKGPSELQSQVYIAAPQNAEPIHPLLVGHPMFGFPTATTGVSSSPNSTLLLSPRQSITAALRSAGTESQQSDTPHRRRRRRYRHGGNTPWIMSELHTREDTRFLIGFPSLLFPDNVTKARNR
ncbi:hypothetical protein ACTXT7_005259 [Hymenolepis weldensis]